MNEVDLCMNWHWKNIFDGVELQKADLLDGDLIVHQ